MTTLIDRAPAAAPPLGIAKVIHVNGVPIGRDAVAREAQNHPSEDARSALRAAAEALVIRELLLQEAQRLGVAAEPMSDADGRRETEEEAQIRALVEREVVVPRADEDSCRRYYENNKARFRAATLFEVNHILLAAPPEAETVRAEATAMAQRIIETLARDRTAFAALAKDFSACPSAATGGNLGQIGPGQTVAEFEAALEAMTPGRVHSEPVHTRYGAHVVELVRRIEGHTLPFDSVKGRIAAFLEESVHRRALAQYVAILVGRAEIDGIDMAGTASPLVQ